MGEMKHIYNELVELVYYLIKSGVKHEDLSNAVKNELPNYFKFYLSAKNQIIKDANNLIDEELGMNESSQLTEPEGPELEPKSEKKLKEKIKPNTNSEDDHGWIDGEGKVHYSNDVETYNEAFKQQKYKSVNEILVGKESPQERFIDLCGPSGNAYIILGMAKSLTKQLQQIDPEKYDWEKINAEMTAGNYNNLVHTFERYFGDYVTIYNADVLDDHKGEYNDIEECSESLDEMCIVPLIEDSCGCPGTPKPKPKPKPKPRPRPHRYNETILEDNSNDLHIIASLISKEEKDERYIMKTLNERAFTEKKREKLGDTGKALPDGLFPIVTVQDLKNAIKTHGRAKNPAAAKAHIKKRAKALGQTKLIPENW